MNYNKTIAGVFVGSGALLLIYMNHFTEGCTLLGGMLGFFVGESNGKKIAKKEPE